MDIVIVESPSKAKTISTYLGKKYKVIASYGHVRSLQSKNGSVKPDKNFEMVYEDLNQSKKLLEVYKDILTNSHKNTKNVVKSNQFKIERLFLATDPDREGEAIAWHVVELLRDHKMLDPSIEIKRVVFNSITKNSINDAFASPRDIDINLVEAQKSRQCLDYLVGFSLSPLLWRKLPCMRSAGRVQSVALRLICERAVEIESFVSQEYWDITGKFSILDSNYINNTEVISQANAIDAKLVEYNSVKFGKFDITNAIQAKGYAEHLSSLKYYISDIVTKDVLRRPVAPFITSTLQQEAFNKLGFSAKFTMSIAQKLYEGVKIGNETLGLITYMRTDGTYIDDYAVSEIRDFIKDKYGEKYLPKNKVIYKSKVKNAQEAHEAIRPTMVTVTPEIAKEYLDDSHLKLYSLIWRRAVACQMENAIFKQTTVSISDKTNSYVFRITGSIISFLGFYAVYSYESGNDNTILPFNISDIVIGNEVQLEDILERQHFTTPPPRFTEARLIAMMEELGIGRPSTYATIISILQDRNYVFFNQKKFVPDSRGRLLVAFLIKFFGEYFAYDFTANLEEELDMVARGEFKREKLLSIFWQKFNDHIKAVSQISISDILIDLENSIVSPLFGDSKYPVCIKCNSKLKIGISKFGIFLGCTSYPECNYLQNFVDMNEDSDIQNGDGAGDNSPMPKEFNVSSLNGELESKVTLNKGPYGYYLIHGEKKFSIPSIMKLSELNNEIVSKMISLPCILGNFQGHEIKIALGKFGFYMSHNNENYSLTPKLFFNLDFDDANSVISLFQQIKEKKEARKALKGISNNTKTSYNNSKTNKIKTTKEKLIKVSKKVIETKSKVAKSTNRSSKATKKTKKD